MSVNVGRAYHRRMRDSAGDSPRHRRWKWPSVVLVAVGGLALTLPAVWWDRDGYLPALVMNVGTAVFLFALLLPLEERLSAQVRSVAALLQQTSPSWEVPEWAPASVNRVVQLSRDRPLDVVPLLTLADAFGYRGMEDLTDILNLFTGTPECDQAEIERERANLVNHFREWAPGEPTDSEVDALRGLASYLETETPVRVRGNGSEVSTSTIEGPVPTHGFDVVVITGAAGPFLRDRIVAGLRMAMSGPRDALIVMSGGGFVTAVGGRGTEADGMYEVARDISAAEGLGIERRVLREDRSRSFRENVLLTADFIQERARVQSRPQRLVFVTAPYAARRLLWTAEELLLGYKADAHGNGAIESIHVGFGRNNWELAEVEKLSRGVSDTPYSSPKYPDHTFARGVERWLIEYFKLIGGRRVGLF